MSVANLRRLFSIDGGAPSLLDTVATAKGLKTLHLAGLPGGDIELALVHDLELPTATPEYTIPRVTKYGVEATNRHVAALAASPQVHMMPLPVGGVVLCTPNFFKVQPPISTTEVRERYEPGWREMAARLRLDAEYYCHNTLYNDDANAERWNMEYEVSERVARLFGGTCVSIDFDPTTNCVGSNTERSFCNMKYLTACSWCWTGSTLNNCYWMAGLAQNVHFLSVVRDNASGNIQLNVYLHVIGGLGMTYDSGYVDNVSLRVYESDLTQAHYLGTNASSYYPATTRWDKQVLYTLRLLGCGKYQDTGSINWTTATITQIRTFFNYTKGYVAGSAGTLPLPFKWLIRPSLASEFAIFFDPEPISSNYEFEEDVIINPWQYSVEVPLIGVKNSITNRSIDKAQPLSAAQTATINQFSVNRTLVYHCAAVGKPVPQPKTSGAVRFIRRELLRGGVPGATVDSEMYAHRVWNDTLANAPTLGQTPDVPALREIATITDASIASISSYTGSIPAWLCDGVLKATGVGVSLLLNTDTFTLVFAKSGETDEVLSELDTLLLLYYRRGTLTFDITGNDVPAKDANVPLALAHWTSLFAEYSSVNTLAAVSAYLIALAKASEGPVSVASLEADADTGRLWLKGFPILWGRVIATGNSRIEQPNFDGIRRVHQQHWQRMGDLNAFGRLFGRSMPNLLT